MAVVDHVGEPFAVPHLQQQRGHEAFVGVAGRVIALGQVAQEALLQARRQLRQGRGARRPFAERPEHGRDVLECGQSLAAHVADDEAGRPALPRDGVEVPAHLSPSPAGPVDGGEPQRADALGERPQQGPPYGVRHDTRPRRPVAVPVLRTAHHHRHHPRGGQRREPAREARMNVQRQDHADRAQGEDPRRTTRDGQAPQRPPAVRFLLELFDVRHRLTSSRSVRGAGIDGSTSGPGPAQ